MKEENLCLTCPIEIRGKCCFFSCLLVDVNGNKYNVILDNQYCEFLDLKTGLCSDYENRKKNFKHCLDISELRNKGSLPKECPYLIRDPTLEKNPKVNIKDIVHKLTSESIMMYNILNNINDIKKIYKKKMVN